MTGLAATREKLQPEIIADHRQDYGDDGAEVEAADFHNDDSDGGDKCREGKKRKHTVQQHRLTPPLAQRP